jgi:monoamine oxidase
VVGAGIAALTLVNALTHAGLECLVLEARDRIGGRLHTVDLGGLPVDLGGSWIHMPAAETADLLGCYLEGLPESAEGLLAKLGRTPP